MLYDKRIARMERCLEKKQPTLTLFFEDVSSSQNLSAIIRSSEAVGLVRLFYSTKEDREVKMHKTITQGAHRWVDVVRIDSDKKVAFLKQKQAEGFQLLVTGFSESAVNFHKVDYTKPTMIILGNEREGVSEKVAKIADATIMIAMLGMVQSLNVSVAAALILYEAQGQREKDGFYMRPQMREIEREALKSSWLRRDMIVRRSKGKISK